MENDYYTDYVIDFKKLNELSINDSIAKLYAKYLDIYLRVSDLPIRPKQINVTIKSLIYNKILINKADIRNEKIENLLDEKN